MKDSNELQRAVLDRVKLAGVEFVHLQFTDIPGTIKSLTVPAGRLESCLDDGAWFDGSSVEGMARVAESDLYLRPDLSTFSLLPWEPVPSARLICDICLPSGELFEADPRNALKRVIAEANALGFEYRVSSEIEFFVFEDGAAQASAEHRLMPIDGGGYFEAISDRAGHLCSSVAKALEGFGFAIETSHHEVAAGQYEMDLVELDALAAADAIVALKWALRAFSRQFGVLVSFMPKPVAGLSGSGAHIKQRLLNRATGASAYFDPSDEYELSATARHFIAGQLANARGMCAIIAPLINSYKRLTSGAEAPSKISWARINRGALVRVPESTPHIEMHVELRAPDPSFNPYLAFAVMLNAGLDGIKNQTPLPEPIEELRGLAESADGSAPHADPLPSELAEALEELQWNPVVREALGQPIVERFLAAKELECAEFGKHISDWELDRYLTSA